MIRQAAAILFTSMSFATVAQGQLTWDERMDDYSAVLPLTLDNNVVRVRAKPPTGVQPQDIVCDIGITGTVMSTQRGTSSNDPGQKVASGLWNRDNIDVQFADRVFTGHHTWRGDRINQKYDFDCGINIKYENKKKVAQVEIRVGYVLPSGDIEGLTWAKIRRKQRDLSRGIAKCDACRRDLSTLVSERSALQGRSTSNQVEQIQIRARLSYLNSTIPRMERFIGREAEFKRDLAAFASLDEYLKTKVHGCQIYIHFHHNGETLRVDIDELKRSRVRPIRVFEEGKESL